MVRIAYLIADLEAGGAQKHLVRLISKIDRQQYEPMIFCIYKKGRLLTEFEQLNVEIIGLASCDKGSPFFCTIKYIFMLKEYFRRSKVDIVHSYIYYMNLLATIAGRLAKVKAIVISKRNVDDWMGTKEILLSKIYNFLTDRILVNCNAVKKDAIVREGANPEKVVVVYNGVDSKELSCNRPVTDLVHVVGTASVFRPKKGIEYFIAAADILLKKRKDIKFILIGYSRDPTYINILKDSIDRLGISNYFEFHGFVEDMIDYLDKNIDIFVLPSLQEGMSNALLEAMAASKPCIVTNAGGNPEVVEDGKTGLVVPKANPLFLANAMEKLLDDARLSQHLGKNARQVIHEYFTTEKMVQAINVLYQSLL